MALISLITFILAINQESVTINNKAATRLILSMQATLKATFHLLEQ